MPPNDGTDAYGVLTLGGGDRYCAQFGADGRVRNRGTVSFGVANPTSEGCPPAPTPAPTPEPTPDESWCSQAIVRVNIDYDEQANPSVASIGFTFEYDGSQLVSAGQCDNLTGIPGDFWCDQGSLPAGSLVNSAWGTLYTDGVTVPPGDFATLVFDCINQSLTEPVILDCAAGGISTQPDPPYGSAGQGFVARPAGLLGGGAAVDVTLEASCTADVTLVQGGAARRGFVRRPMSLLQ